jgi:hypothetical protein
LNCNLEDTANFLREAAYLGVIHGLSLGMCGAAGKAMAWEVGLSPVLLRGEPIDDFVGAVVQEHRRRREEDYQDWELLLTEYVGLTRNAPAGPRCLRRVLLAFLNTGEDVVDEGCGACSGCRLEADFLPLAERAGRIVAIPPDLWSRLEEVRQAVEEPPAMDCLQAICAFLERPAGARWRPAVYLNAERMLREDRESVGATTLLLCFAAYGWADRAESHLAPLFEELWRRPGGLGKGLAPLACRGVTGRAESPAAVYWRARIVHAEHPEASAPYWRAVLDQEGVPRDRLREAAGALSAEGPHYALLAARLSNQVEEACAAYEAIRQVDLGSADVVLEEALAVLGATRSDRDKAEVLAGLLLAASRRGTAAVDLAVILDGGWPQVVARLSDEAIVLLCAAFSETLAGDGRWPTRFLDVLDAPRPLAVPAAVLALCARFLHQGGSLADRDRHRLATALEGLEPTRLRPADADRLLQGLADLINQENVSRYALLFARAGGTAVERLARRDPVAGVVLLDCGECARLVPPEGIRHLWNWAVEHRRSDLVRRLVTMAASPEGRLLLQALVEELVAGLLEARRTGPDKATRART